MINQLIGFTGVNYSDALNKAQTWINSQEDKIIVKEMTHAVWGWEAYAGEHHYITLRYAVN